MQVSSNSCVHNMQVSVYLENPKKILKLVTNCQSSKTIVYVKKNKNKHKTNQQTKTRKDKMNLLNDDI